MNCVCVCLDGGKCGICVFMFLHHLLLIFIIIDFGGKVVVVVKEEVMIS